MNPWSYEIKLKKIGQVYTTLLYRYSSGRAWCYNKCVIHVTVAGTYIILKTD